jgi:hypothetical protein
MKSHTNLHDRPSASLTEAAPLKHAPWRIALPAPLRPPPHPSCSEMSNRIALVDCNLPLTPWDGLTLTLTANVACDEDDVLGLTTNDIMFTTRGFEIEEAGSYVVLTSMPEGWSGFRVVKCGSCWDRFEALLEPGSMGLLELTPGRYYVLLGRKLDEPAELGLALGRL